MFLSNFGAQRTHLLSVLLFAALAMPRPSYAQIRDAERPTSVLTRRDAWWALGGTAATLLLIAADGPIAHAMAKAHGRDSLGTQSSLAWKASKALAPVNEYRALYLAAGSYAVGRIAGKRSVASSGLHGVEAILLSRLVGDAIGYSAGRGRPWVVGDSNAYDFELFRGFKKVGYRSFPSRHVTGWFALASVVDVETRLRHSPARPVLVPLLYTTGSLVGAGRMYSGHHWFTDVASGALLGTLAGRTVARYHAMQPRRFDRWMLGAEPRRSGLTLQIRHDF